jgi:exonuclease III
MIRLITLNSAQKKLKCDAQCEWIQRQSPDIVALQEVTPSTVPSLLDGLRRMGFAHIEHTVLGTSKCQPKNRACGVLIASRFPINLIEAISSPWPEKALSVRLEASGRALDIHTVYIPPGSSNGWIKVEVLESIFQALAQPTDIPRILCGDFNTPQVELENGSVITWGQRIRKDGTIRTARTIRGFPGERWDQAERNILTGLAAFGLMDVFRGLHGYGVTDFSWTKRWKVHIAKRRYDHIFASPTLSPLSCEYLHKVRELGISDHSALVADFNI